MSSLDDKKREKVLYVIGIIFGVMLTIAVVGSILFAEAVILFEEITKGDRTDQLTFSISSLRIEENEVTDTDITFMPYGIGGTLIPIPTHSNETKTIVYSYYITGKHDSGIEVNFKIDSEQQNLFEVGDKVILDRTKSLFGTDYTYSYIGDPVECPE